MFTYKVFNTVVEQKSLNRAAKILNITPSAVSHSLKALEKQLGLTLLTRGRHGVTLTNSGEAVLEHIRLILAGEKNLQDEVNLINGINKGTVNIGSVGSICVNYFPDIIKTFNEQFPNIDIHIYQDGYRDIEVKVADGSLDLGLVSYPTFEDIQSKVLFHDRMFCIAPPGYRPINDDYVTVEDIRKMDFLLPSYSYDRSTLEFVRGNKLMANLKHEISTDNVTITLVENGMGLSILPELCLRNISHNCSVYPIKEFPFRKIAIATTPNQIQSPPAKKLMMHIINYMARIHPE